jgi:hypothetical protein
MMLRLNTMLLCPKPSLLRLNVLFLSKKREICAVFIVIVVLYLLYLYQ